MGVKWDGLDGFKSDLRTLPDDLTAGAAPVVMNSAERAAQEIIAAYPRKSGDLRAGVTVIPHTRRGPYGTGASVVNTARHAHFYDYGTSRQPARKVFVPIAIARRRQMHRDLTPLLATHNFRTSGDV